jgi:hypothetical protein
MVDERRPDRAFHVKQFLSRGSAGQAQELAEVGEGLGMFGAEVPVARAELDLLPGSPPPCARRRAGAGLSTGGGVKRGNGAAS